MKKGVAFLVATALACTPPGENVDSDPAIPTAEIEAFLQAYRAASEARDTSRMRSMYVDDTRFQWIEDGQVRYRTPEEVMTALGALPADFRFETEYGETEIVPVGRGAAVASMDFVTSGGEGDSIFQFEGRISMVIERGPSGLRIVTGHTSTVQPEGWGG